MEGGSDLRKVRLEKRILASRALRDLPAII